MPLLKNQHARPRLENQVVPRLGVDSRAVLAGGELHLVVVDGVGDDEAHDLLAQALSYAVVWACYFCCGGVSFVLF
jgi:hypothetical protein